MPQRACSLPAAHLRQYLYFFTSNASQYLHFGTSNASPLAGRSPEVGRVALDDVAFFLEVAYHLARHRAVFVGLVVLAAALALRKVDFPRI